MTHPHSALHIYQFLYYLQQSSPTHDLFDSILLSLRTPRFAPVTAIAERWGPTVASQFPTLSDSFNQLMASAARSPDYDALLLKVADHYPLIYRVSCFLENDLQLECFVRCLCLDSSTPVTTDEVKQTLLQFFRELPEDTRDYVQNVVVEDTHGYLSREDAMMDTASPMPGMDGFLDLDKVYDIIHDPDLFDQFMAIIQSNTARGVIWSQTIQEVYELVAAKGIWNQLAPLLQQVYAKTDTRQYESYQDYVQKNFLDDGGQQYLDEEINRAQVEHMFSNLTM